MPRVCYTENDIEDMVKSGTQSLELNDNVMLTDLAYEKANRLGLKLVRITADNPPAAPVRPYISQLTPPQERAQPAASTAPGPAEGDLHRRIRTAVITRMGNQIDPTLLDLIIQRVLASTGVK